MSSLQFFAESAESLANMIRTRFPVVGEATNISPCLSDWEELSGEIFRLHDVLSRPHIWSGRAAGPLIQLQETVFRLTRLQGETPEIPAYLIGSLEWAARELRQQTGDVTEQKPSGKKEGRDESPFL